MDEATVVEEAEAGDKGGGGGGGRGMPVEEVALEVAGFFREDLGGGGGVLEFEGERRGRRCGVRDTCKPMAICSTVGRENDGSG